MSTEKDKLLKRREKIIEAKDVEIAGLKNLIVVIDDEMSKGKGDLTVQTLSRIAKIVKDLG